MMMGVPFYSKRYPFWRFDFSLLDGSSMKKIPRVDVTPLRGHRGTVARNATRPDKPKGILDPDAANCLYCRLALGEGAVEAGSREASFDDLCAWHKARVLSSS